MIVFYLLMAGLDFYWGFSADNFWIRLLDGFCGGIMVAFAILALTRKRY